MKHQFCHEKSPDDLEGPINRSEWPTTGLTRQFGELSVTFTNLILRLFSSRQLSRDMSSLIMRYSSHVQGIFRDRH